MATTDDLYRIVRNVNQVMVPVMVKDASGTLVSGLTSKDFQVLENGTKQAMNYFTSDPFPLSAAVIFDFSMSDTAIQKVNRTFSALEGAFSQFDEVSLYTYGSSVSQASDFYAVGSKQRCVERPEAGAWTEQRSGGHERAFWAAGADYQWRADDAWGADYSGSSARSACAERRHPGGGA